MASCSIYSANSILNYVFNAVAFQVPGLYFGLLTSNAGLNENDPGTWTEVNTAGTSYARVDLNAAGGFSSSTAQQISNVSEINFPIATADWGTITHTAIFDSAAAGTGNVIVWGPLLNPRIIYNGDSVRVPQNAMVITLT